MEYRIEADTTYDYEAYKALGKLYSRIIYKYRRLAGLFLAHCCSAAASPSCSGAPWTVSS